MFNLPKGKPQFSKLEEEQFDIWNEQKKALNTREVVEENERGEKLPKILFNEGEIWWSTLGKNIGKEVYGKGENFMRPVYVFRKISAELFFGIPLTSREKVGTWFHKIETQDRIRWAIIPQMKSMSVARLAGKIVGLPEPDQKSLDESVKKYLRL